MLDLVNQERTSRGLDRVVLETDLNQSAEDHSEWQLGVDRVSHTGRGGSTATERIRAAGFELESPWKTGENLAMQSLRGATGLLDDVRNLHRGLMDSASHRANILDPEFDYIGIGIERGVFQGQQVLVITQNFAETGAAVVLDGDGGVDRMQAGRGHDRLFGRGGDDHLYGAGGRDRLEGDAGDDRLYGQDDRDRLYGGSGRDRLNGGDGADRLHGEGGGDRLAGGAGGDRMWGGSGDDTLKGGAQKDRLDGGSGDDVLNGGASHDRLSGGAGHDRLIGSGGSDLLRGGSGNDRLEGGSGHDELRGDDGRDRLEGGSGHDELHGRDGDDRLSGGKGDDRIIGGDGDDTMGGGGGDDVFVFSSRSGRDEVANFKPGHDLIEINGGANDYDDLAITSRRGDLVVRYADSTIVLEDLDKRDVGADDFLFT